MDESKQVKQRKNLIVGLAMAPMLLIPAVVALIAWMAIESERVLFTQTLNQLEHEYQESKITAMRSKVDSVVDLVAYRKSVIKQQLHERIQRRVSDSCKLAHSLYDRFSATYSEEEVQQMIISALRPLVWNEGESFIWILDYDGVFYLAPEYLRHLEGTSIIDFRDATGREVIKEEIELVTTVGEGFIWDTFTKPGESPDKQFEQLAYVKKFGHFNWYMGSAEYLDTATAITDKGLLESISKVDQAGSNDLFIFNAQGKLLLSSAFPSKVGMVQEEVVVSAKPNHFEYDWLSSISRPNQIKHVYVKHVPGTDWTIGSLFYDADMDTELSVTQASLTSQYEARIQNMQQVSILGVVVAVLVSLLLSMLIYRMLMRYRDALDKSNSELQSLNVSLEENVQKRTQELELANSQLELLASTDSLTGIQNRYAFMNVIEAEVKRADRYQSHFSVLMFDIDYFKRINDEYGHDIGDNVLIELTGLVQHSLRDVDSFCRLGGEEFVILLPYTNLDASCLIAERIRQQVEAHVFNDIKHLTISLGVVEHEQGEAVDKVLKRADIALYESKRAGRNQVSAQ